MYEVFGFKLEYVLVSPTWVVVAIPFRESWYPSAPLTADQLKVIDEEATALAVNPAGVDGIVIPERVVVAVEEAEALPAPTILWAATVKVYEVEVARPVTVVVVAEVVAIATAGDELIM